MIMAAQDQGLRTNSIKRVIDKAKCVCKVQNVWRRWLDKPYCIGMQKNLLKNKIDVRDLIIWKAWLWQGGKILQSWNHNQGMNLQGVPEGRSSPL